MTRWDRQVGGQVFYWYNKFVKLNWLAEREHFRKVYIAKTRL